LSAPSPPPLRPGKNRDLPHRMLLTALSRATLRALGHSIDKAASAGRLLADAPRQMSNELPFELLDGWRRRSRMLPRGQSVSQNSTCPSAGNFYDLRTIAGSWPGLDWTATTGGVRMLNDL